MSCYVCPVSGIKMPRNFQSVSVCLTNPRSVRSPSKIEANGLQFSTEIFWKTKQVINCFFQSSWFRQWLCRGGDRSAKVGVLINIHKDPYRKMYVRFITLLCTNHLRRRCASIGSGGSRGGKGGNCPPSAPPPFCFLLVL